MSERSKWHIPSKVEVNGQPWNPVKTALFLVVFFGFCIGLAAWRRLNG